MAKIAQINVNKSRPAQGLIVKVSCKEDLQLITISEPNSVSADGRRR